MGTTTYRNGGKPTFNDMHTVNEYIRTNPIRCAPCCDVMPEIIVDNTGWGQPAMRVECRKCRNKDGAIGNTHIEALNIVMGTWNLRYILAYLAAQGDSESEVA